MKYCYPNRQTSGPYTYGGNINYNAGWSMGKNGGFFKGFIHGARHIRARGKFFAKSRHARKTGY